MHFAVNRPKAGLDELPQPDRFRKAGLQECRFPAVMARLIGSSLTYGVVKRSGGSHEPHPSRIENPPKTAPEHFGGEHRRAIALAPRTPPGGNPAMEKLQELLTNAQDLVLGKLVEWLEAAIRMLPNLVVAALVLLLFGLIARLARRTAKVLLSKLLTQPSIVRVLSGAIHLGFVVAGLFLALTVLKLDKTVTSLIAGAGVVGLALSFAFQDLATNFVSGLFITLQRPLRSGDLVQTGSFLGIVEQIGLRSLMIRDLDGQDIIIPSKDVFQQPLTNFSALKERRVSLECGVGYDSDLPRVKEIVVTAIQELKVVNNRPVELFWSGFGDSSIDFVVRFWIDAAHQRDHDEARSHALVAVHQTLGRHGVTIPFPIRTLDFDPAGGRRLAVELSAHREDESKKGAS